MARNKIKLMLAAVVVALVGWLLWPHLHPNFLLNASDECLRGREAAMTMGGVIDTMNSPPKPGCSGYDQVTHGDVGTYVLGTYEFHVPRDYVIFGKYQEGPQKDGGLLMRVGYPSLEPVLSDFKSEAYRDSVKVFVKHYDACPESPCESAGMHQYRAKALRDLEETQSDRFTNVEESSDLSGFKRYTRVVDILPEYRRPNAPYRKVTAIYFKGDVENPDEWYVCGISAPNPHCETKYKLDLGLWVELSFSHRLLDRHTQMREEINKLLVGKFLQEK